MPTKKKKPEPKPPAIGKTWEMKVEVPASKPTLNNLIAAVERVLGTISGLSKDDQRRVLKAAFALVETVEPKVTTWTTA